MRLRRPALVVDREARTGSRRSIAAWGTGARLVVGSLLAGSVLVGSLTGDGQLEPAAWLLGLVGFPLAVLAWHGWRIRRTRERIIVLSGPLGHLVTLAVFLLLYGTTWYAPSIGYVSDAALLFFGSSMLLAALRGYAGCEVLSISNWLLERNDQVGCVLFEPIDNLEADRR